MSLPRCQLCDLKVLLQVPQRNPECLSCVCENLFVYLLPVIPSGCVIVQESAHSCLWLSLSASNQRLTSPASGRRRRPRGRPARGRERRRS